MRRYLIPVSFIFVAFIFFLFMKISIYADCGTPIGAPHQGAAKYPMSGSFIYGIAADISYGTPHLGCLNRPDSFTDEWIMVVGPGPEEWLQFGWEKKSTYQNAHFWYQYHHQGAPPVDVSIPYEPATTHTYMILSMRDSTTGEISWWLVDNGTVLRQFTASQMGWTHPTQGASEAQWSAELSYSESEMGDVLPNFVSFDNIIYQEGTPSNSWYQVIPSWTFNSFVPKYGGDTIEIEPYHWKSRNWTWPYQIYLPLLNKGT